MARRKDEDVSARTARPIEPAWLGAIDRVARERLGRRDLRGPELARAVAYVSRTYTRDRDALGLLAEDDAALGARLRFFLPRDLAKIELPLEELARAGALPPARRWRVLDVGAGLGATALGVARFARAHEAADAIAVHAVDRDSAALEVLSALGACTRGDDLAGAAVPVEVRTTMADIARVGVDELGGPYDLVLVGLALNELWHDADPADATARRAARLVELASALADDGTLVVIEPALRATSRALQAVRDVIAASSQPPFVFAPCLRRGPCPMLANERDWCHDEIAVALPRELAEVASAAGLRREDLTFSHLTLRRDGRKLTDAFGGAPGTPLRIVSERLESKGKVELFACGEPGLVRLQRLHRHASTQNAGLDEAVRGTLVALDGAPLEGGGARARVGPDVRASEI